MKRILIASLALVAALPLAAGQKLYNTDRFNGYRMKRVGK